MGARHGAPLGRLGHIAQCVPVTLEWLVCLADGIAHSEPAEFDESQSTDSASSDIPNAIAGIMLGYQSRCHAAQVRPCVARRSSVHGSSG